MFGGNLVISQPSKDREQRWGATPERMATGILSALVGHSFGVAFFFAQI